MQPDFLDRSRWFEDFTPSRQRPVNPLLPPPPPGDDPRPKDIEVLRLPGVVILARNAPCLSGPPCHVVRKIGRPPQGRFRDPVPFRRSTPPAFHPLARFLDVDRDQL